ncbi:MAG: phosphatase PAP2 family protein [Thermoanaerobaculia bacterium]
MIAVPFLLYALVILGLWLALYHLVPAASYAATAAWRWVLGTIDRHPRLARGRAAIARRTEPLHSYIPAIAIAAVGAVAAVAAGDLFLDLAEVLEQESAAVERIDQWVWESATLYHAAGTTAFFTFFTIVGTPVALGLAVAIIAIAFAKDGRWRWAAYLVLTTSIGGVLNWILKAYFHRQRPDLAEAMRSATGYSFPSGHAMGSTIVFGALAYLAMRYFRSWRTRSAALSIAIASVLAICLSRVYLGVHWLTDIVAGVSAGLVWVLATTASYETFRRARLARRRDYDSRAVGR